MDASVFWNAIANYNQHTLFLQIALFIVTIIAIVLTYTKKINWLAKAVLGIDNLFIAIGFFACYGTEKIQRFFAFPLYLMIGIVFLYECVRSKEDELQKPTRWRALLLVLYFIYPLVSMLFGGEYPRMVTYIMPCPIVSLSIAVYSGYTKKNKLLLILLTIWGLTGIKSFFFNAYEDTILLLCGIYGLILVIREIKASASCKSKHE